VAVAVREASVLVLDAEFRIVEVSPALEAGFGLRTGEHALDRLPISRNRFVPYCEHARRTGETVELVEFCAGSVVQIRIVPQGDRLQVSWETLGILDTLTIDGLDASLRTIVETLAGAEDTLRRERLRRSLRLVGGGG
jgi:hypothetical protein